MSKLQKEKNCLKSLPKDYSYTEAKQLLSQLGFIEYNKGKTSGSRIKFYRESDGSIILLHKPHPYDEMRFYAIKNLYYFLKGLGEL